MTPSLTKLNNLIHDQLKKSYIVFLEDRPRLDERATRASFTAFAQVLDRHRVFEDTEVLPLLRANTDIDPMELARISGDHKIIERTLARLVDIIDTIFNAEKKRRTLVCQLSGLARMQGLLEHHTERETRFVYPVLDQKLSHRQWNTLAQGGLGVIGEIANEPESVLRPHR